MKSLKKICILFELDLANHSRNIKFIFANAVIGHEAGHFRVSFQPNLKIILRFGKIKS